MTVSSSSTLHPLNVFLGIALCTACQNGHESVVQELINDERVDPSVQDNYAIRVASKKGYTEMVRCLLRDPVVDPSGIYFFSPSFFAFSHCFFSARKLRNINSMPRRLLRDRIAPFKSSKGRPYSTHEHAYFFGCTKGTRGGSARVDEGRKSRRRGLSR